MKVISSILLVLSVCAAFSESMTAQQKDEYIWNQVLNDSGNSAWWWFPFKFGLTIFNDMKLVFEQTDFMQKTWYTFGLDSRPKTLHSVGVLQ